MTEEILSNLTEQQLAAVTHKDGPMLVVAGAGSGKTRVVTRRIAWLLQNGVWPQQILAMTFTNKAAREMKERVSALTGGQAPANIGTFHSCCARFLRRDIGKLGIGLTTEFTIYDEKDRETLLRECMEPQKENLPGYVKPREVTAFISRLKNRRCAIPDAMPGDWLESPGVQEAVEAIVAEYGRRLLVNNAVDFDDLLLLMYRLLDEHPELAEIYHSRFRYLLVDEYQDTNHLQYDLVMKLTNPSHNLHVTGDPDQSIYSWRGADYSNIMSFTRDFPEAKVIKLEQNYRSTQVILDAANSVIANNANRIRKELFTKRPGATPIWLTEVQSDSAEAEMLGRRIRKLHDSSRGLSLDQDEQGKIPGGSWRDYAILYRTNAQSRPVEEFFVRTGIPYQIFGGIRFYDRKEIRDTMAPLRLRLNPSDAVAFERLLGAFPVGKGIGPKSIQRIIADAGSQPVMDYIRSTDFQAKWCAGNTQRAARMRELARWWNDLCDIPATPLARAVRAIYDHSRYDETLADLDRTQATSARENIGSLFARADEFTRDHGEGTLEDFIQELSLVADSDPHDNGQDAVLLMTMHSAKGLEFRNVFIIGLEDGILPHRNALGRYDSCAIAESPEIQEERRLFYVGITRARRAVYLSYTRSRMTYEGRCDTIPSRFIRELPSRLVQCFVYHHGHEASVPFPATFP